MTAWLVYVRTVKLLLLSRSVTGLTLHLPTSRSTLHPTDAVRPPEHATGDQSASKARGLYVRFYDPAVLGGDLRSAAGKQDRTFSIHL